MEAPHGATTAHWKSASARDTITQLSIQVRVPRCRGWCACLVDSHVEVSGLPAQTYCCIPWVSHRCARVALRSGPCDTWFQAEMARAQGRQVHLKELAATSRDRHWETLSCEGPAAQWHELEAAGRAQNETSATWVLSSRARASASRPVCINAVVCWVELRGAPAH